jgi:hypothetical protein
LQAWLSRLPAGAAASLLAGIEQSAKASRADFGSSAAQAAVEALHELAGATGPALAPQPLDDQDPGKRPESQDASPGMPRPAPGVRRITERDGPPKPSGKPSAQYVLFAEKTVWLSVLSSAELARVTGQAARG